MRGELFRKGEGNGKGENFQERERKRKEQEEGERAGKTGSGICGERKEVQRTRMNGNMQQQGLGTGELLEISRHQGNERLPGPSGDDLSQNAQQ